MTKEISFDKDMSLRASGRVCQIVHSFTHVLHSTVLRNLTKNYKGEVALKISYNIINYNNKNMLICDA